MGGTKISRSTKAMLMSKCVSISETIVTTVCARTGIPEAMVSEAFNNSAVNNKLFNFSNEYHNKDILDMIEEFIKECEVKYGWKQY